MNSLIRYFINRSFVVNLLSAMVILAGLVLGSMIKRDITPAFEFKSAFVTISLPGASATEVEKYLAYPVEQALQGLPHAKELETRAEQGKLRIQVFFNPSHDEMQESIEQIRSRVDGISWQLPEQSRDIKVEQNKVDSVFHMGIALEKLEEQNPKHRMLVKRLADDIRSVPGIIRVYEEMNAQNVYVKIRPEALSTYEISIAEIRQRLRSALNYSPIGRVDFDEKTFTVEVERPAEAIETFNNLTMRSNSTGNLLKLKDLAEVSLQIDEIKERHRYNGAPAINLYTRKDISADTIALKGTVQKVLDKFNESVSDGIKATIFIDTPKLIQAQLQTLTNNAIFGMILVLLILTLFFNWKVSLVTSFGIPIAYCGTLIAIYAFGISIDIISVVGMILVLGILVDDAIIIAERYIENLEKGLPAKDAAFEASRDLMIPVTGTILTTVFAFTPMVLIESEIAVIFYAVPVVIIVSLAMSWLESFFILPNHLYHFIKEKPKQSTTTKLFDRTQKTYKRVLSSVLSFRYLSVLGLIAFFAASVWLAQNKIQQEWWFGANRERIAVRVVLKENISLDHTEKFVQPIENYLMSLPKDKFKAVNTSVGEMWTRGRNYKGYRYARVSLHIADHITHPKSIKDEYTEKLRDYFKEYQAKHPEIESIKVGFERNDEDEKKNDMVTIDVSGHEDVNYLDLKKDITKIVKDNKFPLELVREANEFDEKWIFKPDSQKMAQHKMSQENITSQLRSYFVPHELMQIRMNGESKWIYTQVDREKVINQEELNKLSVLNSIDLPVPISSLGSWYKKQQLALIKHRDGKRFFAFDFSYEPSDTMNVVQAKAQASTIVSELQKLYPTYQVELKDADRAEASSRAWGVKVAILCIVLVMFTLALVLNSLSLPFLVGLPIPFGLMGIVWALYLHDMTMGIMALIGLVGTVGVSVNDSLIMVDQILKRGAKRGALERQDIIDGAASRLRAIILTTVTTLGGVSPMAYGIGGESGFTQPLAFSLGWGLFFSTFLTLFILPAFIEIRRDIGKLSRKLWSKITGKETKLQGVDPKEVIRPSIQDEFIEP